MTDNKKSTQDNSLAHVIGEKKSDEQSSYDPDRYVPKEASEGDFEEGVPLESEEPDKGYSTDAGQGKQSASLHLADEDIDRRPEDPMENAKNLQESLDKSIKNSKNELASEESKKENKE